MFKNNPSLFGIVKSNRDFLQAETWGKNQFNNSFPVALLCYMASQKQKSKYLCLRQSNIYIEEIGFKEIVGLDWDSKDLFFSFESEFLPYARYLAGKIPRADIVFHNLKDNSPLASLEIKLTVLPDNTTCELSEDKFGSELVIRPDTIVYLVLSLLHNQGYDFLKIKRVIKEYGISSFDLKNEVLLLKKFLFLRNFVKEIIVMSEKKQRPFIMQPIWKTCGKSPIFSDNCLDCFIWSDIAFLKFILEICKVTSNTRKINRQVRSVIWFVKMFIDYFENGTFSPEKITNQFIYGLRNDKAFAVSGFVTNYFMSSKELARPRIKKNEIKNIIRDGGEKWLSPERRLDAVLFYSTAFLG